MHLVRGTHEWNRADQNTEARSRYHGARKSDHVKTFPSVVKLPHRPSVHPTNNNCPHLEVHSVSSFECLSDGQETFDKLQR